jgi:ribonucleoside-diphosphate reductase alpha chain
MAEKLTIDRYFSPEGDVYEKTVWDKYDARITDERGDLLFTQEGTEFPDEWSQASRDVVASRYFFGEPGTQQREYSARQIVDRVSETISEWGTRQGYFQTSEDAERFRNEIRSLTIGQRMAFNSPVWFNVGANRYLSEIVEEDREAYIIDMDGQVERISPEIGYTHPQTSACFIQSVDDTMESILDLSVREGLLFKHGSGTGTNLSSLRSSREKLSNGGRPSGPLEYLKFHDRVAGIIQSGGRTRRAAKKDDLDISHPDIWEFIESKSKQQKIIRMLIAAGLTPDEAIDNAHFQNTNISVRVTDDYMEAVEKDTDWKTIPVHNMEMADQMPTYRARHLWLHMAENAHFSADPGLVFHDTVNNMHTCPRNGPIRATNPCAEYNFVDDSSCNLASHNLMRYMDPDGVFNIEEFGSAVRTTAIAQDLLFDNSSYPTSKIAENSHRFRPLGMGYANLGALVMSLGLPYDSDEARATAAAITAYMTGKVYETSTEMAEAVGTFEEYEKNKEPFLEVMEKHRAAISNIDREKLPKGLEHVLDAAIETWDKVIERGSIHGFRNAQATVLAPTGTIGFMMGCDTTGIEPELGLIKTKRLAEGGYMEIENQTVSKGLIKLGYTKEEITSINEKIIQNKGNVEDTGIKDEHLAVFDTSFRPGGGSRYIAPEGHLKMMAAAQPFISGAISKTVNLPEEATVEDIADTYNMAWKLGIKAVAVYRDKCKENQPLTSGKLEDRLGNGRTIPERLHLPALRDAKTIKFDIADTKGFATYGFYPDGRIGELFLRMSKEGSTLGGLADSLARQISLSLQYGIPPEEIIDTHRHHRFEPRGLVRLGHPEVKTADSIPDYIVAVMEKFIEENKGKAKKETKNSASSENASEDLDESGFEGTPTGRLCAECGQKMYIVDDCKEACKLGHVSAAGCGG